MLKLSRSVIAVIVAMTTLPAPVAAVADPAPPPPPKIVHTPFSITKTIDLASPPL
jgi:hypothetical protein